MQAELDMFFVKCIMVFDYTLDDLEWAQTELPIGSGSFADVYLAKLKDGYVSESVALKVCRDDITRTTVGDILLEDRTLRFVDYTAI
jgi:predicted unusual protein kinase regulating ubiquinone biosynthesis (AarF/ABC1/UbiB family)